MDSFVQRFAPLVLGVLHGFDRLRLRGSSRWLSCVRGVMHLLWKTQVLLKDFAGFAQDSTSTLRTALEEAAKAQERPVVYLPGSCSKEEVARDIATRHQVRSGLVVVLSSLEPCLTFRVRKDKERQRLVLRAESAKCLHYYHYYLDPELGWLHTRLQSWFPFPMQVCLNGRDWLARQMDQAGLGYVQRDNCFSWLQDVPQAQALADNQLRSDWPELLNRLALRSNPLHERLLPVPTPYYWSVAASEWASDVLFHSPQALATLMPAVLRHGLHVLGSADVLRFLGHKTPAHGGVHGHYAGEALLDYKDRPEGQRLKFQADKNWLKLYDKQGSVLRIETVLNAVAGMKAFRSKETEPDGPKEWRKLRKGVADLHRRAQISQQANDRYGASLAATLTETTPLQDLSTPLCQPVRWQGRRVRALNPLAPADAALLEAVQQGEFLLNGFRNREVRVVLYGQAKDALEQRRQAAAVTRHLRLLRAHGLIRKVPKTHRYVVSEQGKKTIAALLSARAANTAQLLSVA
jgi:hypothetical protein